MTGHATSQYSGTKAGQKRTLLCNNEGQYKTTLVL